MEQEHAIAEARSAEPIKGDFKTRNVGQCVVAIDANNRRTFP